MNWPWKKLSITDRISALQMGSARLQAGSYDTQEMAKRDLEYLVGLKEENRNIADLSKHPGWIEIEAVLVRMVSEKLRTLARKHRTKDPEADWDAHFIEIVNAFLLGLVNNSIYESAHLERLINNKLTAKARLEEMN